MAKITPPKKKTTVTYKPEPTAELFHKSPAYINALCSAVGQGKTTAAVWQSYFLACQQYPDENNLRYTKALVVRSTYPELASIVIPEIKKWFGHLVVKESLSSPMSLHLEFQHPSGDGTLVRLEMMLVGMDDKRSLDKLRSYNGSWAWLNETDTIEKVVFDAVIQRINRTPFKNFFGGIIMDYNPPSIQHWLYQMLEVDGFVHPDTGKVVSKVHHMVPPLRRVEGEHPHAGFVHKGWTYIENPDAEGVQYQPAGINYWKMYLQNKPDPIIRRFVLGEYVPALDGTPVFTGFRPDEHIIKQGIKPLPHKVVTAIFDWGLHAACILTQVNDLGQLVILDEFYKGSIGLKALLKEMKPVILNKYKDIEFRAFGDPSGGRSGIDIDMTPYLTVNEFFKGLGKEVACGKALTNSILQRIEAGEDILNQREMLVISGPDCPTLVSALQGSYRYEDDSKGNKKPEPVKDKYSHIADVFQYGALDWGAGGGDLVSERKTRNNNGQVRMKARRGKRGGRAKGTLRA